MAVAPVAKNTKIASYATEGDRWAAVVGRDQSGSSDIYCSVRMTGT